MPAKQPASQKNKAPVEQTEEEIPALEAGMVCWDIEVDGVPCKWSLNYNQAHLPVTRGRLCSFQGKVYRVSKIYGTSLYLTSQESETYAANAR